MYKSFTAGKSRFIVIPEDLDILENTDSSEIDERGPFEETNETIQKELCNKVTQSPELIDALESITEYFSARLSKDNSKSGLKEIELTFSLSLEKSLRAWLIGAKGKGKIDLKLKWEIK